MKNEKPFSMGQNPLDRGARMKSFGKMLFTIATAHGKVEAKIKLAIVLLDKDLPTKQDLEWALQELKEALEINPFSKKEYL